MHMNRSLANCPTATVRRLSLTVIVVAVDFVVILDAKPDLLLVIAMITVSVVVLDAKLLPVAFCRKQANTLSTLIISVKSIDDYIWMHSTAILSMWCIQTHSH